MLHYAALPENCRNKPWLDGDKLLRVFDRVLDAKNRSRLAAYAKVATLKTRWEELGDQGSTGALVLEALLRTQERVTLAEFEFAKAL